jgi:hypothetical protein
VSSILITLPLECKSRIGLTPLRRVLAGKEVAAAGVEFVAFEK